MNQVVGTVCLLVDLQSGSYLQFNKLQFLQCDTTGPIRVRQLNKKTNSASISNIANGTKINKYNPPSTLTLIYVISPLFSRKPNISKSMKKNMSQPLTLSSSLSMDLQNNMLTGEIPASFSLLKNLTLLNLLSCSETRSTTPFLSSSESYRNSRCCSYGKTTSPEFGK